MVARLLNVPRDLIMRPVKVGAFLIACGNRAFGNFFSGGSGLINPLRIAVFVAVLAGSSAVVFAGKQGRADLSTMVTPIYTVEGDAFVKHNGDRYSNRPLYCNHIYAIALAGDKPTAMVGKMSNIYGNLMFAFVRGGHGVWLQNASDITSKYRPGRMEWTVGDQSWGCNGGSSGNSAVGPGAGHGGETARGKRAAGRFAGVGQRSCHGAEGEHPLAV